MLVGRETVPIFRMPQGRLYVFDDIDCFFAAVCVAQEAYKVFHGLKKAWAQLDST